MDEEFQKLMPMINESEYRLMIILRLAAKFHRRRSPKNQPRIKLTAQKRALTLILPIGFLAHRHLTHADLLDEIEQLKKIQFQLDLQESDALGTYS